MNYKGDIKDFPREVVEWMLDQQVKQGNKSDVSVFEEDKRMYIYKGGFEWNRTKEGWSFCNNVIHHKNFDLFFQRYPKKTYPKVMEISDDGCEWHKRVVFMEKNNLYFAWVIAETIEEANNVNTIAAWKYAREIKEPQITEVTLEEVAKMMNKDVSEIRIKK